MQEGQRIQGTEDSQGTLGISRLNKEFENGSKFLRESGNR